MVDESQQPGTDESSAPKGNSDNTAPGDDWGEDWESAFQAEEFLFSADEQKNDPDGTGQTGDTGYDFTPPDDTNSFGDLPDLDSDSQPVEEDQETGDEISKNTESGPGIFFKLKEKAAALPTTTWLAITATLTILFIGTLFFLLFGSHPKPTSQYVQESGPENTAPIPEIKTTDTTVKVKSDIPKEKPLVIPPQVEKIRAKWPFEPFLIATQDQETHETTFVSVKLTLITLVDEGADLPQDKKPFIRDMIFQFFANRPFYELRRYSLARGEMNRKLLEWLRREWPQGDVTAIIIHRYKLG